LPLLLAGASLLAGGLACRLEPSTPVLRYELSDATRALGEDGRPLIPLSVQEHIRGSLEMLFGTPSHPQYMLLGEWIDEAFDPNWPTYEVGDFGSGEFDEGELEAMWAENGDTFRRQLSAIAEGRYGSVEAPDWAPDLQARWTDLLADFPAEERGEEFQAEAAALFEEWYPTLRDSAELYRQQCLHCHGPEGGGNGPTADFLDPRPRDYRKGIFKFTPMRDKAQPRREDLYRILDEGVTGTSMPSFRRFSRAQLNGLVDYVRLLAMRGMVEADLAATYEIDEAIPAEYVAESYSDMFSKWRRSEEQARELVIAYEDSVPEPTPESIARGRELFMDAKTGNCFSCHGPAGRGDGLSAWTVDPETGAVTEAYQDDWGRPIRPRNLTQGLFRGGRRPIDVFRRIKAGINGTPMPALGDTLPDEDLWAIVHYVGTLTESGLFYPERHAAAAPEGH
jgi:mono/diheme cytochrome c family protein